MKTLLAYVGLVAAFSTLGFSKVLADTAQPLEAEQSAVVETLVLKAFEKEWLDRETASNRDFAAMRSADDDVKSTGTLPFPDSHFQIVTDANGISVHLHYQRGRGAKALLKTDSFSIELTAPLKVGGTSLPAGTQLTRTKGAAWSITHSVTQRDKSKAQEPVKHEDIAPTRKWTDSTGKYTVEAEFVDFKEGKVRLRKGNGSIVTLPIERLGDAEQQFIKAQAAAKADEGEPAQKLTIRWPKGVRTDPTFTQIPPMHRVGVLVMWPGTTPDFSSEQPVAAASQWLDGAWNAPGEKQDQAAVEAIEKTVASALESCGFSSSRVAVAKGDRPRDAFTKVIGLDGLLLIRVQTQILQAWGPGGQPLATAPVMVEADVSLFRAADLKPLMVSGLLGLSVIGAELGDGKRTMKGLDYAVACASVACRELDRTILCSLQSAWQKSDIERSLAGLRERAKDAMPKPTESRFNDTKTALLEVSAEGEGKTATLVLGGNWPRRWTASMGRVVHVVLEPGTYPIALEERSGNESRQYAGRLVVTGGKAYLYSIR